MDHNAILVSVKSEMKAMLDDVSLAPSTIEAYVDRHQHCLSLIKSLAELYASRPGGSEADDALLVLPYMYGDDEPAPEAPETGFETAGEVPGVPDYPKYLPVERKLKGAIVTLPDGETEFLPETKVRELDVSHGDIVKIEPSEPGSRHAYQFTLHEKSLDGAADGIIALESAIISYDDVLRSYVIKSYVSGSGIKKLTITTHGTTLFKVNHKDVADLGLEVDDIVDVAHYDDSEIVKVRWRYDVSRPVFEDKPKKPTFYKDGGSADIEDIPQVFEGRTICVLGAESRWQAYGEEVAKRGGDFEPVQTQVGDMIETEVMGADVVVLPIRESSHVMCEKGKEFAKKHGVPYVVLYSVGRSEFVKAVEGGLGI